MCFWGKLEVTASVGIPSTQSKISYMKCEADFLLELTLSTSLLEVDKYRGMKDKRKIAPCEVNSDLD